MKRSEMLNIIDERLNEILYSRFEQVTPNDILHIVEQAGMLPPPSFAEAVTGRIVYAYYNNEQVEELNKNDLSGSVNRSKLWDNEDE